MTIPRAVHRWWQGEPDPMSQWTMEALRRLNPGWQIVEHDSDPSWINFDQVVPEDAIRHASNVIRYEILANQGGMWVDHDVVPLKPFESLVAAGPFTAGLRNRREGSVLAFPAAHPMLVELLDDIRQSPKRSVRSCDVSGASVLDRVGRRYPEVRLEPLVVPLDAVGETAGIDNPVAIHLWATSSRRALGNRQR